MRNTVAKQPLEDLQKRLKKFDSLYVTMLSKATPYLILGSKSGREINYKHTLRGIFLMLDFLETNKEYRKKHDILVPAIMFHDIGYCKLTKEEKGKRLDFFNNITKKHFKQDNSSIGRMHEKKGAALTEKILREINYKEESIEEISYIVSVHDQPDLYKIHRNAEIVGNIDRLMRYEHFQFWAYIKEGKFTFNSRIKFLEKGLNQWFSIPEIRWKAQALLDTRRKEQI